MAKMGISTLASYHGAQLFEAVGLSQVLVQRYFTGTTTRLGGIGLEEIEAAELARHRQAYARLPAGALALPSGGEWYWRRDGEAHQWNPETVAWLQRAARFNDSNAYREFAARIDAHDAALCNLRGLLDFDIDPALSVPIDNVESVESIVKRFFTSSMSFGALSREVHEAMAVAMHRLGGQASEGGERAERFGTERGCDIKQVSKARFGVTCHYLVNATDIEIKMAQGSKPGEGGHLPGSKVNEEIARVRHTVPGVGLISPPPHHDIYSIEDLAQLSHDLKCANENADIHVKLVAKSGVGTIAAGVVKARADAVLITGDEGGTGASAKSSIKHAGLPWELGLAETQQTLLVNGLRSRVRLRLDGGLKTGRDVAIGALLGAEALGFGTAALVTLGCVMLRKCHCNTCSVGIATQDPELRKRFAGQPEHLMNYLWFVAQQLREIMARLGFTSVDDMVGQAGRLKPRAVSHPHARRLDLSALLHRPETQHPPRQTQAQDHRLGQHIDRVLIQAGAPALIAQASTCLEQRICNQDRSVGAMLSTAVSRRWGAAGLSYGVLTVHWKGTAGQSFGAFLARGITFSLSGMANDYVAKGLSGGVVALSLPATLKEHAGDHVIAGNVALFGATAGELYASGRMGDRFAVRNAGAFAVVEGLGAHGCEYMTGGAVVVLGSIGPNFGAGMSGGEAYLLDGAEQMPRINTDMVDACHALDRHDQELLCRLLENHAALTGSRKARHCLEHWAETRSRMVKIMPRAYAHVVEEGLLRGRDPRPAPPAPAQLTAISVPPMEDSES